MKSPQNSVDGFVTRRPQRKVLSGAAPRAAKTTIGHARKTKDETAQLHTGADTTAQLKSAATHGSNIKESISSSLEAIDQAKPETPRQKRKKVRKKKLIVKITSIVIGLIVLAIVGFFAYKALSMMSNIFQGGNPFDLFSQQPLKEDAYGRSNILIVGTTDDDPQRKADGDGALTDSMMVLSVNQTKKDAYMYSIPRDLYVQFGMACNSGYAGKINEYFNCVNDADTKEAEQQRMDGIREFVGKIFGMDIQYVAHINTLVIRDAVNAVGGVTVNVESRDPRGVLDASIDWMCTQQGLTAEQQQQRCPTGHYIDFKNGPADMDGDKAMWFSRARGVGYGATYGLEQSNFDREQNQQRVIMALKDKALSSGTLTDVGKITKLMDAMGENLRTNVETKEIRTIMKIASELDNNNIKRLSFVEEDNMLMTTGSMGGASIVQPAAGLYVYSEIQAFLRREIYATDISKEKASVVVLNGSGTAGAAQTAADELEALGMDVVSVDNAPSDYTGGTTVYRLVEAGQKTATSNKLKEIYGREITQGAPSFTVGVEAEFVVIIGE